LRVDHTGAGRVGAAVQATKIDAEDVMNLLPKALIPPGVEVVADRLPGREVMRQHPPGTTGTAQITDGVDDLPAGVGAGPTRPAWPLPLRREEVFDVVPLQVGQVTRIALSGVHTFIVADPSPHLKGISRRPLSFFDIVMWAYCEQVVKKVS